MWVLLDESIKTFTI